MRKNISAGVLSVLLLSGCVSSPIDDAISQYDAVSGQVELGQSKEQVLAILNPTQIALESRQKKEPERYIKDGVKVEIYFMRSKRQPDGLTTDDEFVPYVFNDGKLVGIGWQVLGGPKTQGQATSDVYINNQNTTIVK